VIPTSLRLRLESFGFARGYDPYHNNKTERDPRMVKVSEKIRGTFRRDGHGNAFCDLRSVM